MISILYIILASIALPLAGCAIETMWKNQLGDVYSLGLGSAACTGAALSILFGGTIYEGAAVAMLMVAIVSHVIAVKCTTFNTVAFGMVFGSAVGAVTSIVCNNISPESLAVYYKWSSTTIPEYVSSSNLTATLVVFSYSLYMLSRTFGTPKSMLFINLMVISVITFTGPIWTISLLAPNCSKLICNKFKLGKRSWIVLSIVIGFVALASTYLISIYKPGGIYLPISGTMSLLCMPIVIFTMTSKARGYLE